MLTQKHDNFTKENSVFDLRDAVAEVLDILEEKKKVKAIHLETNYDSFASFVIKTDKIRMQQVFLNLISNAIKFTPKEGTVKVSMCLK